MSAKPFNIDITSRDKTEAGVRSVEKRFERMGKSSERLNRATERWTRGSGFGVITRGLSGVAGAGANAARGLASAIEGTVGLGTAAGAASWMLGGLAAAAFLTAGAATKLGIDWSRSTTSSLRAARGIGMATAEYQKFQLAAKLRGVSPEAMAGAMQTVGDVFHDAAYGRNPEAQAMLLQLGIRLKRTKAGAVDVKAALLDIAGALEGRNPQTQRKIAEIFGVEGALPFLRQGRGQVQKDLNTALASGAIVLDKNAQAAEELTLSLDKLDLRWQGLKRSMTENWVIPWLKPLIDGAGRDNGLLDLLGRMIDGDAKAKAEFRRQYPWLTGGVNAGGRAGPVRSWNDGRFHPGGGDFGAFAQRIEWKESRGRQLDGRGRPLTSPMGAVGVMQMLPATGQATARKHNIAWDPNKFRTDAEYNRRLGRLHLWDLREKYGGSEVLAAAAYNAGEGRLDGMWLRDRHGARVMRNGQPVWQRGWLDRFGDPRKGEISEEMFTYKIPYRETQDYVMATAGYGGMGKDARATVDVNFRNTPVGATVETGGDREAGLNVKVERAMPTP